MIPLSASMFPAPFPVVSLEVESQSAYALGVVVRQSGADFLLQSWVDGTFSLAPISSWRVYSQTEIQELNRQSQLAVARTPKIVVPTS